MSDKNDSWIMLNAIQGACTMLISVVSHVNRVQDVCSLCMAMLIYWTR